MSACKVIRASTAIVISGDQIAVTFVAEVVSGPGYSGLQRHYALQSSSGLSGAGWATISGYADLVGNGQTVTLNQALSGFVRYYRFRVWLSPQQ